MAEMTSTTTRHVVWWRRICWILVGLSLVARPTTSWTTTSGQSTVCPSVEHEHLFPYLSVLIPAYNEEHRLGKTLESYHDYLTSHPYWGATSSRQPKCQIVVVDDGSTDQTAALVTQQQQETKIPVTCVRLSHNVGKGAALAAGVAHVWSTTTSRGGGGGGGWILTADADASAPLSTNLNAMVQCVQEWCNTTNEKYGRRHNEDDSTNNIMTDWGATTMPMVVVAGYRTYASAAPSRLLFRWGFRTVVRTVAGDLNVRDSQCGFKLLSTVAAERLYTDLYLPSWSHDVEILYRAKVLNMTVLEQAVEWQDKTGSKLMSEGLWSVVVKMFVQVFQLRWNYATGVWKLPQARSALGTSVRCQQENESSKNE